MSLLAPLFLIGLGLLALPVWLHRLQTDNPERESFASTMFLEPSQKRVHVRRRLRHLILMALRLLFLALLVFAFAKPALKTNLPLVTEASDRMHILVVDISASMSSPTVFSDAKAEAEAVINATLAGEGLHLFSFAPSLVSLAEPTTNKNDLLVVLNSLQSAPVSGDIGILMGALSRLDWSEPLDYQVHIVSDLQQTALPDRYADMIPDLPAKAQISFNFYPVSSAERANWAIDSVREEEGGLRIAVRGYETSERNLEVSVQVDDGPKSFADILVPESGRASMFVPAPEYQAGVNSVTVQLQVEDELAADNQFHLVVDRLPPEPVLLLTSNPFAPAATYLSAVMSSIGDLSAAGSNRPDYRVQAVSLSEFDPRTLERYSWLLIDDIGSIDGSLASSLLSYLESGGALFAAAGQQSSAQSTLPVSGHQLLPTSLGNDSRFYKVSQVDESHVMLNDLEGWSDLNFSRSIELELNTEDRVLVALDNGNPLLIEQQHGQGKLLLLASSMDNQWNDLPIKPLYVSLMAEVAGYLSDSDSLKTQLFAGETLSLNDAGKGGGQLIDPKGQAALALGNTSQLGVHQLNQIGFYEVYTPAGQTLMGVNVHPAESNLTTMADAELENWIQALGSQATTEASESAGSDFPSDLAAADQSSPQREFWFGLLCLAALFLLCESLFANMQMSKRHTYGKTTKNYQTAGTGVTP